MPGLQISIAPSLLIAIASVAAIFVALRLAYRWKPCKILPPSRPVIAILPKYRLEVRIDDEQAEIGLAHRLNECGFYQIQRNQSSVTFVRGFSLGDFSIKIAKLAVKTSLPLRNPVQLNIGYGGLIGCVFDTGDLWLFCQDLTRRLATQSERPAFQGDSANPYRTPKT